MCGITGYLEARAETGDAELRERVGMMAAALRHRGPDDEGVWVDSHAGIALGHRRLSVLDVSSQGHQPMASRCGRYVVSFNGEIYNCQTIRSELERTGTVGPWRGHSDTEIMLEAIARWGLEATLERLVGMFAFALWERQARRLLLVRDRFGEKPLYYGRVGSALVFGSELRALRAHPGWRGEVDRSALSAYTRYGYVPHPFSIYQGIYKVPPGHWVAVSADRMDDLRPSAYWSASSVATASLANPYRGSMPDADEEVARLLRQSVAGQRVADVPLGTFLSGGVDSSLVTALLAEQSAAPIQTFTIGFREWGYNEAPHAARVARRFGTAHTELYVSAEEGRSVIPTLPQIYDEPFADSSQIPTYLVSRLARSRVTVALSGDGGDEVFGGYNRYTWAGSLWRRLGGCPAPLRGVLAASLRTLSPRGWDTLFRLIPTSRQPPAPGDKLHKLADALRCNSTLELYQYLQSQWPDPGLVVKTSEPDPAWLEAWNSAKPEFVQQMMLSDTTGYLPGDILVKVDRAAMAVGLEARAPFLDHRLFEFVWRLPLAYRVRGREGKLPLKRLLTRYLPDESGWRPKQGFGIPVHEWLRGPLRDWAECLLDPKRLTWEGWFEPGPVHQVWREHLSGSRNWQYRLWPILMFQAWHEQWR